MRNLTPAVAVAISVLALACNSKPKTGAASLGTAPVVAPFAALSLPTEGGNVWFCDAASINIVYDGGDKAALGAKYEAAVVKHGWTVRPGTFSSTKAQWMTLYDQGGKTLTIQVSDADFSGKVPGGVQVFLGVSP